MLVQKTLKLSGFSKFSFTVFLKRLKRFFHWNPSLILRRVCNQDWPDSPEKKDLPLFGELLFFISVTKEVENVAWRGDKATSYQFLVILINLLIFVQVQRTKKHFSRLIAKFTQIDKLTKKNEAALLSIY